MSDLVLIDYRVPSGAQGDLPTVPTTNHEIGPASVAGAAKINELAVAIRTRLPAQQYVTEHDIWGGVYTRTVRFPAGTIIAAARFLKATTLIINGTCDIWCEGAVSRVSGYTVIRGYAGRKIALVTVTDVQASMAFRTDETDVEKIQMEFTDEYMMLEPLSNSHAHIVRGPGE